MQVSFVCTDHRTVSRSTEERLNRQNTGSPSMGAKNKFRTVAMVARSLGQLTVHAAPSSSEHCLRTGMKYRCTLKGASLGSVSEQKDHVVIRSHSQLALFLLPFTARQLEEFSAVWHRSDPALGDQMLSNGISETWGSLACECPVWAWIAEDLMTLAYENGINLFDTAEVYAAGKPYGSYKAVDGLVLAGATGFCLDHFLLCRAGTLRPHMGCWLCLAFPSIYIEELAEGERRSSLVITTKIYWGGKAETERGLSRKHIIEGLRASLERLQLEYVDVVFANRPDPNTPMEETVRAMTHVINQGMAMYWGTSRWSSMEIMEAYSVARQFNLIPPICEQAEYHMFQREKIEVQLPELYHKIGVGAMTWSPLACGIISGKYDCGVPPCSRASLKGYQWLKDKILSEEGRSQQAKLKELQAIAERLGCTLPQLAIAWCLRNEGVSSVLLGASNTDQLLENIGAIQVLPKLSSSIVHEVDSILGNKPYTKKDYRS
ncbi:hypothetical protein P4O66_004584 [Electrophorus voltai]|uniref:Voltage-gated potassium channel subunit beta-1 n=1 Tax=Electrophorus voltai TaxID=2609070 RepID=A0AAD9DZM8_9TELE|nr:hypothetical protein P4O66_004584 [Electrophorus voltai]